MNLTCLDFKFQKSKPGAGYHVWHCEQGDISTASRVMTYILYLNDIKGILYMLHTLARAYASMSITSPICFCPNSLGKIA